MNAAVEIAAPMIEPGSSLARNLQSRLERARPAVRDRMAREIASQIALLAPYLEPCYRASETASFLGVSAALDPRDGPARRIHDGLTRVSRWFYQWRDRLSHIPDRPKLGEVMWLVEGLDRLLFLTGLFGAELVERAGARSLGESERKLLASVADRYNRFLVDYERLWCATAERSREPAAWPTLPVEAYYERLAAFGNGPAH